MEGGRVTVWVGLVAACVLLLGSAASADLFAVAKPTTQSYGSVWNGAHQRHRG